MGVKHGEGVAVTDADDLDGEGGRGRLPEGKKRNTTQSAIQRSLRAISARMLSVVVVCEPHNESMGCFVMPKDA